MLLGLVLPPRDPLGQLPKLLDGRVMDGKHEVAVNPHVDLEGAHDQVDKVGVAADEDGVVLGLLEEPAAHAREVLGRRSQSQRAADLVDLGRGRAGEVEPEELASGAQRRDGVRIEALEDLHRPGR